jgi:hypothetical protein
MADPEDMVLPLLREMRAENRTEHEETRTMIRALDRRMGGVEEAQKSYRQALSADSLLSKLVTGEFEQRIEMLERKVRELESSK